VVLPIFKKYTGFISPGICNVFFLGYVLERGSATIVGVIAGFYYLFYVEFTNFYLAMKHCFIHAQMGRWI
jgi:hypothetical protein